uniref:Uncharacterized protein n=1 Tax=Setaria digitata TaxID=48799 RepID=A0A915Q842_9BILA
MCLPSYAPPAINMVSPSSPSTTTTAAIGRSSSYCIITRRSIVIMRLLLIACVPLIIVSSLTVSAQEVSAESTGINEIDDVEPPVCHANEVFNGKTCKCAPG